MLRERYRAASAGTPALFGTIAARLAADPASPDALSALQRELHRVRGTAGSYGFLDVSGLAGALESRVVRWCVEPAFELTVRAESVEQFAAALTRCFEQGEPPTGE